jgi:hypothetical protein
LTLDVDESKACLPPLMLQVLPGVKRVPIFPKGRQIANADCKTPSTLSVGFDSKYRVIFYATQAKQKKQLEGVACRFARGLSTN